MILSFLLRPWVRLGRVETSDEVGGVGGGGGRGVERCGLTRHIDIPITVELNQIPPHPPLPHYIIKPIKAILVSEKSSTKKSALCRSITKKRAYISHSHRCSSSLLLGRSRRLLGSSFGSTTTTFVFRLFIGSSDLVFGGHVVVFLWKIRSMKRWD